MEAGLNVLIIKWSYVCVTVLCTLVLAVHGISACRKRHTREGKGGITEVTAALFEVYALFVLRTILFTVPGASWLALFTKYPAVQGIIDLSPEVMFFSLFWTLLVRSAFLSRMDFSPEAVNKVKRDARLGVAVETVGALLFVAAASTAHYIDPERFPFTYATVFDFEGIFNMVSLLCVIAVSAKVLSNTSPAKLRIHPRMTSQIISAQFFRSLVMVLFIVFCLKACVVLLLNVLLYPDHVSTDVYRYSTLVYFLVLEIVPCCWAIYRLLTADRFFKRKLREFNSDRRGLTAFA
ncbi:hypothetical protein KIPB_007389 [Kipferlia bialata]|uniref:Uncharacterized protein n=1 Tax=Kipferlia bialata TaxID=797122 RepID=A0A9K3GJ12_9EUKA|nr:hypothetical protein KIPB_003554 [Kipferlia bialata]GIQ84066.1 hypothetical protein KIPB_005497 [Kipferlia bialata]GIQ85679.1 hypothetical protein KIPB_007389 [Kipferlia bialata]|eukprot:g3554.t1